MHDVPGTLGKHLRATLQCGAILVAEAKLYNPLLLEPDDAIGEHSFEAYKLVYLAPCEAFKL